MVKNNKSSLAERLKAQGVDMSWYENNKNKRREDKQSKPEAVPHKPTCGIVSAYKIKVEQGSAKKFTVHGNGKDYMQVGTAKSELADMEFYLCEACNRTFKTWEDYNKRAHFKSSNSVR